MSKNWYQSIRTQVKKNLRHVMNHYGMEYAIRARTSLSVPEAEQALRQSLTQQGFHVVHDTDVKGIHNHYDIEYPEFKILKIVKAQEFTSCPMASNAVRRDPTSSSVLPPGIILYEMEGQTYISAVRPSTLLIVFTDEQIQDTILELEEALWNTLDNGVPQTTMLSNEPPASRDRKQANLKKRLNKVVSLVDAEYHIEVSSPDPPKKVKRALADSLDRRGQKVLGEVANGTILLAVNPGQAHKALAIDPDVAVFAPLSISVFQEDGRTVVRSVRPSTLLIFFEQEGMQNILMEMEMLLWNSIVKGVPNARVESRQPPLQPEGGQEATAGGLPGGLGALRKETGEFSMPEMSMGQRRSQ